MEIIAVISILFVAGCIWAVVHSRRKLAYIEGYKFSAALEAKFRATRPEITADQEKLVLDALRQYFYICRVAGGRLVSMPSQIVDDAWHEFILFTREYQSFCQKALGRFLHHVPAEAMKSPSLAQEGI